MTRQEARQEINSRPELVLNLLTKSKGANMYNCIFCESGTGKNGTGALSFKPGDNYFKCFSCNTSGDTLEILKKLRNCTESEIFRAEGLYINEYAQKSQQGASAAQSSITAPTAQTSYNKAAESEKQPQADYTSYYKECQARITEPEAAAYLKLRGISPRTAAAYGVGYDSAADPIGKGYKAKRLIIPVTSSYYIARAIDPATPKEYKAPNPKGSKIDIFNKAAINSEKLIFVTEGIFDALAVIEAGAAAIALNGATQTGTLIKWLESNKTSSTFILCLDNDEAGKQATETLINGLQELNISYNIANICGGCKDPNEALTTNREKFIADISAAKTQALKPDNAASYIDNLMYKDIEEFKKAKDIKTGFTEFDTKTKGLYAGLYIIGAISSLGKTTFCHQIADQLANSGQDVLFFSLEQSRLELVSKSLARKTAKADMLNAVNSLSIRRGYLTNNVLKAAAEYKQEIGDRLSIIEGNFNCNISFISDYIRRYIERTNRKPIVFIDYLQILQPGKDEKGRTQSTKENMDITVTELKRLSRAQGLTIFAISSINRSNYLAPIDFESFKESGGIEYTADVVIGLQLQCLNEEIFDKKDKVKQKGIE